jgi:hypothetical protein
VFQIQNPSETQDGAANTHTQPAQDSCAPNGQLLVCHPGRHFYELESHVLRRTHCVVWEPPLKCCRMQLQLNSIRETVSTIAHALHLLH